VVAQDGTWSVDVAALGGQVDPTSRGDAFLGDSDGDMTRFSIFVTALSLDASASGGRTLQGARAREVRRGARVRLAGALSARTPACTKDKTVKLEALAGGSATVLGSTRTSATGRYAFTRTVKRTTSFRVRYAGRAGCQASKSRVRKVRVSGR
jgi:hypothetical protein